MDIIKKLIDAGLTNRDFTLEEAAEALGVGENEACLFLGAEIAHNDHFSLVYRINGTDYECLSDIPHDTNIEDVTQIFHFYVEPEYITRLRIRFDDVIKSIIVTTGIFFAAIVLTGIILNIIK